MKSKISRRSFLRNIAAAGSGAAALGLLAGCSSSSTAASSGSTAAAEDKYTPGTYSASKTISYSEIGVSMTFDANSITACEITSSGEQDLLTDDKKTAMAKAIVEGQSADVDAVTSCTLVASVGAIQECVADCIAQATGTEVEKPETTEVTGRVPGYCGPGDWLGEAPADPDKYEDAGTTALDMWSSWAAAMPASAQPLVLWMRALPWRSLKSSPGATLWTWTAPAPTWAAGTARTSATSTPSC